jgi:pyruvate/2-oxoglutarate dehydrogenase complex dihydrolipoamide acyltransferase (E2) component
MPFWYHLPVPELNEESGKESRNVRLVSWLVDEGTEVHTGTTLAIIETDSGSRYEVLANGDGFLRKRLFPVGADVPTTSPLATIAADGEKIPYDRPHSTARRMLRP